jgi:hypothetical protein
MGKLVAAIAFAAASLSLGACAATDGDAFASPHYHPRDNKQGAGPSSGASAAQPAQKPLHDHRQMK